MIPRERFSMLTSQLEVKVCSHSPEANTKSTAGRHWSLASLASPESSLLCLKAIITNVTRWFPRAWTVVREKGVGREQLRGCAGLAWPGRGRGVNKESNRAERTPTQGPTQQSTTTLNVGPLYSPQEVGEAILHSRENSNPLPSTQSGRIG